MKKRITKQADLVRLTLWMKEKEKEVTDQKVTNVISMAIHDLNYVYPYTAIEAVAEALSIKLKIRGENGHVDPRVAELEKGYAELGERLSSLEKKMEDLLA